VPRDYTSGSAATAERSKIVTDHEERGPDRPPVDWALDKMADVRQGISSMFPPEFRQHVRAARREFWLAVRSLVDARLEAIETEGEPKPQGPAQHGRIDVQ
jgi:hypothetical protein